MNIRKAQLEDVDALAGLFDQYRIFYQQPSDIEAAKQFLTDRIRKKESEIFLAFLDGKLVGFTQLYPVFSSIGLKRSWVLNDLYVVTESRGSGAADALLKAAQNLGADTSSQWLVLQTASHNHRAQRVYERNLWEKDEEFLTYYFRY